MAAIAVGQISEFQSELESIWKELRSISARTRFLQRDHGKDFTWTLRDR